MKNPTIPPPFNEIVCIGTGLSGIGLAIQLKRKYGFTDIHLYDRNSTHSGTWESNRYPGCACDVTALYYSYSFETKSDWSTLFPLREEIWGYLDNLVSKYNLRERMTFRTEVESAVWDENRKLWTVFLRDLQTGMEYSQECRILFSAVGVLVDPKYPDIPGMENFKGATFHTARWKDGVDMAGKNVVLLGNGSSATQTVPHLIPVAKSVIQFIRQPHWLFERKNPKIPPSIQRAFENIPGFIKLIRAILFILAEKDWRLFIMNKMGALRRKQLEGISRQHVLAIAPEKYQNLLIPEVPVACKRRVYDQDGHYMKMIHSPNFHLTNEPILEILPEGVQTAGQIYPADIIVYATGFVTNKGLGPVKIQGRNGEWLDDHWKKLGGPGAYNNTAVHGFPNFMILYGPNSTTGHNSVIFTIESHLRYSLKIIEPLLKGEASTFEVNEIEERNYVQRIQKVSKTRLFYAACTNWYVTDGWNATLYPWTQVRFWWASLWPKWSAWTYQSTPFERQRRLKRIYRTYTLVLFTFSLIAVIAYRHPSNSLKSLFEKLVSLLR
ncbi:hypothetical protein M422DRAFT_73698 [Sphaerobolus stellatus SS14]|nr:hypothetical protein M422DRAFT_73698 [Sphaerobolus stellatus SS14]